MHNSLPNFRILIVCLLFLMGSVHLLAQKPLIVQTPEENGEIEIIFQKKLRTVVIDGREINYFQGDVIFKHDDVYIFCDSGSKDDKQIRAWGNVVIKQGDTLNIFSDQLFYDGNTKIADLQRNVVLENLDQKLFTRRLIYDVGNKVATYTDGATLTDDKTYLRSKRGNFFVRTNEALFKDSVVVLDPEFSMKTDSLRFQTKDKIATFIAPTLITFEKSRIYTEAGYYDIKNKFASFQKRPQYLSDKQRSKARLIEYDGNLKEVKLYGEALFEEEERSARGDTILFFEQKDLVDIRGSALYLEGNKEVAGKRLLYDRKKKQFKSPDRVIISDPPQILEADSTDFDDESGLGIAIGQVHWQDTSQKLHVFCEEARIDKAKSYIKAWGGRPVLAVEVDNDWLFIAGDTLVNFKLTREEYELQKKYISPTIAEDSTVISEVQEGSMDTLSTVSNLKANNEVASSQKSPTKSSTQKLPPRKTPAPKSLTEKDLKKLYEPEPIMTKDTTFVGFETLRQTDEVDSIRVDSISNQINLADVDTGDTSTDSIQVMLVYHHVQIFRENMRGVCDSLSFNTLDSIFTFYQNPIFWSDSTQFFGDTMNMQLKDKKVHQLDLLQNALIISTPNEVYFDQIRGRIINAFFKEGEIDNVLVSGNAETVYYAKEDDGTYTGVNSKQSSKMRIFFEEKEMNDIRFYDKPDGKFIPMSKADHAALQLKGFKWEWAIRPADKVDITTLKWIPWDIFIVLDESPETDDDEEENQESQSTEPNDDEVGQLPDLVPEH